MKNNSLYQCGGYRVAIQNGITFRSMWFQSSWNFHPFLPNFYVTCLQKKVLFLSHFITKYDIKMAPPLNL